MEPHDEIVYEEPQQVSCTDIIIHPGHYSKWTKAHPIKQIIGESSRGVQTRRATSNQCLFVNFLSLIEPKKIGEALEDPSWIEAMQEELVQFERNKVWSLVPVPKGKSVIGTRWVFRNKMDEDGVVIRNKARLVA